MKLVMSPVEKIVECRRLIDYARTLDLKDPKQLQEIGALNKMIKQLNKECEEDYALRVPIYRRIVSYFRLKFVYHVRLVLGWTLASMLVLVVVKLVVMGVQFFWGLW